MELDDSEKNIQILWRQSFVQTRWYYCTRKNQFLLTITLFFFFFKIYLFVLFFLLHNSSCFSYLLLFSLASLGEFFIFLEENFPTSYMPTDSFILFRLFAGRPIFEAGTVAGGWKLANFNSSSGSTKTGLPSGESRRQATTEAFVVVDFVVVLVVAVLPPYSYNLYRYNDSTVDQIAEGGHARFLSLFLLLFTLCIYILFSFFLFFVFPYSSSFWQQQRKVNFIGLYIMSSVMSTYHRVCSSYVILGYSQRPFYVILRRLINIKM